MTRILVVVACGRRKLDRPARAEKLYTGPLFRACLLHARRIAPKDDDIRILSAKHGLLALDWLIAPYDLRLGQRGSVQPRDVAIQAEQQGVKRRLVIVLGGGDYVSLCRGAWDEVRAPLQGCGGIGKQLHWLREQAA